MRDMWLTGFDAPCLHTMYADKPMKGHGPMQAIAVMLGKHGIACDLMHAFQWDKWTSGKPTERLQLIPAGPEHLLEQEDGKKRWVQDGITPNPAIDRASLAANPKPQVVWLPRATADV